MRKEVVVWTDKCKSECQNFIDMETSMSKQIKKLENVKEHVSSLSGEGYSNIVSAINQIIAACMIEKNQIQQLKNVLDDSMNCYIQTEKKITENKNVMMINLPLYAGSPVGRTNANNTESSKSNNDDTVTYTNSYGYEYKIGDPQEPEFTYDNDFVYDPDAEATAEDIQNWIKWECVEEIGPFATPFVNRDMPDAFEAYSHYREGNGEDLIVDYEAAYNEDVNIKTAVNSYVIETQKVVEQMIADGQKPPFSVTSGLMPVNNQNYPCTENWQKTLGAHNIWISADVTVDENGNVSMDTTVHAIDRYNFNKGQSDIASGTPDDINGRFEELGWAHSFTSKGELNIDVEWQQGDIYDTTDFALNSSSR